MICKMNIEKYTENLGVLDIELNGLRFSGCEIFGAVSFGTREFLNFLLLESV